MGWAGCGFYAVVGGDEVQRVVLSEPWANWQLRLAGVCGWMVACFCVAVL